MTYTLKSKTAAHDAKRIEDARKEVAARNKEEVERAYKRRTMKK